MSVEWSPIRVGDIVTRGQSRLEWRIEALHTDVPNDGPSIGWAELAPIGDGRYTRASAQLEALHLVRPVQPL